jgi:hypothetical protein
LLWLLKVKEQVRDNSVSEVTVYELDIQFLVGKGFLFTTTARLAPPIYCVPEALFMEMFPEQEADHSPASRGEIKQALPLQ